MLKPLAIALVLVLSPAALAGLAEAARVAVLLSAKVNEYEDALKRFKEEAPHEIVAVYDMDGVSAPSPVPAA
jgi:hypothetical protein